MVVPTEMLHVELQCPGSGKHREFWPRASQLQKDRKRSSAAATPKKSGMRVSIIVILVSRASVCVHPNAGRAACVCAEPEPLDTGWPHVSKTFRKPFRVGREPIFGRCCGKRGEERRRGMRSAEGDTGGERQADGERWMEEKRKRDWTIADEPR